MVKKLNVLNWKFIFCCLFITACNSKDNNKPAINFSKDSTSIVITNIDQAGYFVLEDKYKKGDSLNHIVSVLESPGEDDSLSMEREFPGKLVVKSQQVIFNPDQPFVKGKNYIVSTLINVRLGGSQEAATDQLNSRAAPHQKTLIR